jgi:hypothetical protein
MNPETKEQPSTSRQWTERSGAPIATRAMTKDEIEQHKLLLMQRFGYTNPEDMKWVFEKIQDEKDNDRDDCLWLKYLMKVEEKGQPAWRVCFTLKIPIPDKLRQAAEAMRGQREHRTRTRGAKPMALPAAPAAPTAGAPPLVYGAPAPAPQPAGIVRPRARKPVVKN